jgi:hypothetical protein
MFQLPSLHWSRRILPLNGDEDVLKQNPLTDSAPQEERIPVSLISDYTIAQLGVDKLGVGQSLYGGKKGKQLNFKSLSPKNQKVKVTSDNNNIFFDVASVEVGNEIKLTDLLDVTSNPTQNGYLKYVNGGWITSEILDNLFLSDGNTTSDFNNVDNTLTFNGLHGIDIQLSGTTFNVKLNAKLTELSDIPTPTLSNTMLVWNGTNYVWQNNADVFNGKNIGNGKGLFVNKTGGILNFTSLDVLSDKVVITQSGNTTQFDVDSLKIGNEINLIDLKNVVGTPIDGSVLTYSGNTWNVSSFNSGISVSGNTGSLIGLNNGQQLNILGVGGIKTNTIGNNLNISMYATLNDLSDVAINLPSSGQTIGYNSTTQKWENTNSYINVYGNSGVKQIKNKENLFIYGVDGVKTFMSNLGELNVSLDAKLTDLKDIADPTEDDQILKWDGANFTWSTIIFGETNTVTNIGTGARLYKEKVGVNFKFKTLLPNSTKIGFTYTDNEVVFDINSKAVGSEIKLIDLNDVKTNPLTNGFLKWNGSQWITEYITGGSGGSTFTISGDTGQVTVNSGSTINIKGVGGITTHGTGGNEFDINLDANLGDLKNVDFLNFTPENNNILSYDLNLNKWIPKSIGITNGLRLINNEVGLGGSLTSGTTIDTNSHQLTFLYGAKIGINVANPTFDLEVNGNTAVGSLFASSLVYANDKFRVGGTQPQNASIAKMFIDNSTLTPNNFDNALQVQNFNLGSGRILCWDNTNKIVYKTNIEQLNGNIFLRDLPKFSDYGKAVLNLPVDAIFLDLTDYSIKQVQ